MRVAMVVVVAATTLIMIVLLGMSMVMAVSMIVTVRMTVIVRMRLVGLEGSLRQGVVFLEGFVVAMLVPATIGAHIRLEWRLDLFAAHAPELGQHVHQHRIVFQLQVAIADFQQHMPVAQVVGGTRQGGGPRCCHAQHIFRRSLHQDEAAIVGHQQITMAQHGTPGDGHADFFACAQSEFLAAATAQRQIQRNGGGAPRERLGDLIGAQEFIRDSHD